MRADFGCVGAIEIGLVVVAIIVVVVVVVLFGDRLVPVALLVLIVVQVTGSTRVRALTIQQ